MIELTMVGTVLVIIESRIGYSEYFGRKEEVG